MGIDSYEAERVALESYFNSQWGSTTSVAWANVTFEPQQLSEFVRFNILPNEAAQATAGAQSNTYRHIGLIEVQIFTRYNNGMDRANVLADIVINIFRRPAIQFIRFKASSLNVIGMRGGWHQVNVTCEYARDGHFT